MKKCIGLMILFILLLLPVGNVNAYSSLYGGYGSGSSYDLGGTTYYNFGNGSSGSAYNIGDTTYYNLGNGKTGTAYDIGGTTYYNFGNGSTGTAYDIGGTTYYNLGDGVTGNSYGIGDTTYYNFSDGTRGTAYDIGGTTHYNFNYPSSSSSSSSSSSLFSGYSYDNSDLSEYFQTLESDSNSSYGSAKHSCPLNASYENDGCYCNDGYQTNSEKSACEPEPVCGEGYILRDRTCITHTLDCQNTFGINTYGNKSTVNEDASSCYCLSGYEWNSNKTECKVKVKSTTQTPISTSKRTTVDCPDGAHFNLDQGKCITLASKRGRTVVLKEERNASKSNEYDPALSDRLSGKILLQVESRGEAWYINPTDSQRYYLGDPNDSLSVMRSLGLGITDDDLEKIPTDSDTWSGDPLLLDRLEGKILLQVESRGQAWYVNPDDGKRYYMGLPKDAFNLMRSLGLGISNSDLRKIKVESI